MPSPEPDHARLMGRQVVVESVNGVAPAKSQKKDIQINRAVLKDAVSFVVFILGASMATVSAGMLAGTWAVILCVSVIVAVLGLLLGR